MVASNIHARFKSNVAYIYDSVFDQLGDESLVLVKTMFSISSGYAAEVQMITMQKQHECNDCGVLPLVQWCHLHLEKILVVSYIIKKI